jgi:L-threonylcarbamoyladenylate synthase
MLRELDARGAASIAVMPIPRHGLGEAINDRLERGACRELPLASGADAK